MLVLAELELELEFLSFQFRIFNEPVSQVHLATSLMLFMNTRYVSVSYSLEILL